MLTHVLNRPACPSLRLLAPAAGARVLAATKTRARTYVLLFITAGPIVTMCARALTQHTDEPSPPPSH